MAASSTERRNRAMLGELPADFLRIMPSSEQQQLVTDAQIAHRMQTTGGGVTFASSTMSRLNVTVTQAKLSKNYGLVKMDPYCRLRLGNSVFETHTAHNGGKNPRWNKTIQCYIPKGIDTIYIEIFDECAFSMDGRVAWAVVPVPEEVFNGEVVDEWFMLNGKQGDGKEGMINFVLEHTAQVPMPAAQQPIVYSSGAAAPVMVVPAGGAVYYPTAHMGGMQYPLATTTPVVPPATVTTQTPTPPMYTEQDVQQVKDMFPDTDEEVIKSVLYANSGNKDSTINQLLSMQEP